VKNLVSSFSDKDLYDMFSKFGEIESSKVIIDLKTGFSRGYGFVKFDKRLFLNNFKILDFFLRNLLLKLLSRWIIQM
jgi:RNA recognition motif-containing protein